MVWKSTRNPATERLLRYLLSEQYFKTFLGDDNNDNNDDKKRKENWRKLMDIFRSCPSLVYKNIFFGGKKVIFSYALQCSMACFLSHKSCDFETYIWIVTDCWWVPFYHQFATDQLYSNPAPRTSLGWLAIFFLLPKSQAFAQKSATNKTAPQQIF